jgi:Domain of unknown function (DUF3846)
MKAVKITTTGEKSVVEFHNDTCYQVLSDAVGGMIECVSLHDKPNQPDMWLNDNGKAMGFNQNPTATALWVDMYDMSDVIMGDVIITGGADDEGYTLGLSDEQVDYFLKYDSQIWNTNAPGFVSFS